MLPVWFLTVRVVRPGEAHVERKIARELKVVLEIEKGVLLAKFEIGVARGKTDLERCVGPERAVVSVDVIPVVVWKKGVGRPLVGEVYSRFQ